MCFPKWCSTATYLPTIEEIDSLPVHWNCNKDDFIYHNPLWTPFQVLNDRFISWLSEELLNKINSFWKDNIKILEVWAWNGRLTYFLKQNLLMRDIKKSVELIATDDLSWHSKDDPYIWVRNIKNIPVENQDVEYAVTENNPDIIISSWMIKNEDWTIFFRHCKTVQNFILIWEPRQCGTDNSWSNCDLFEWQEISVDGNISWTDWGISWWRKSSKIVMFSRKNED